MRKHMLLLPAAILLLCRTALSQEWQTYTKLNSGLPGENILAIAASPGGEDVWFGLGFESLVTGPGSGGRGLAHYQMSSDRWEVFNFQQGLVNDVVTALAVEDHTVWVGTEGGASRFDRAAKTFHTIEGLSGKTITAIVLSDSLVWFGADSGLVRYSPAADQLRWLGPENGLDHEQITALAREADRLWIGTAAGLRVLDLATGGLVPVNQPDLAAQHITALCAEASFVWAATAGAVFRFNPKTGGWESFPERPGVLSISCDRSNVWFGTGGNGVYRFNSRRRRWQTFTAEPGKLLSNTIRAVAATPWGVWFGSANGASRYSEQPPSWASWNAGDLGMRGFLNAIAVDENAVWTGGVDGVSRYDKATERWQHFDLPEITEIEIGRASVWAGDKNGVLHEFERHSGQSVADLDPDDSYGSPIEALALDGETVWVGTLFGIYQITGSIVRKWSLEDYLIWGNGPAAEAINAIAVGDKYVWFGPSTNIFEGFPRYEKATGRWRNDLSFPAVIPEVKSMAVFREFVWFGTFGIEDSPGLYLYDRQNAEWVTDFVAGEILYNSVYAIAPDSIRNYVWFGTSAGAGRYDLGSKQWHTFTTAQGLISDDVQDIAVDRLAVWFATGGGGVQGEGGVSRFVDASPPAIIHAPPATAWPVRQAIKIEAQFRDNVQILEPQLFYKTAGESEFVAVPMQYRFADVWSATIPANAVSMQGVQYYLRAFDGYQFGFHPWRYPEVQPHFVRVFDNIPPAVEIDIRPLSGMPFVLARDRIAISGRVDGTETVPEISEMKLVQYNSLGANIGSADFDPAALGMTGEGTIRAIQDTLSIGPLPETVAGIEVQISVTESDSVAETRFSSNRLTVLHDTEPPLSVISEPRAGDEVGARVLIRGTAYDVNFLHYALAYGTGDHPKTWQTILVDNPRAAIVDSVLAIWHTIDLPDTLYTLRLTVQDVANHTSVDSVRVRVNKRPIRASAGGLVQSSDGLVSLIIVPNALEQDTPIFINPVENIPQSSEGTRSTGVAYQFEPENIAFRKPVTATFHVPEAALPPGEKRQNLALFRWNRNTRRWQRIGGTLDRAGRTLRSPIGELGLFALMQDLSAATGTSSLANVTSQPRVISPRSGGLRARTAISFELGRNAPVTVKIYNPSGRLERTLLADVAMQRGVNTVEWDGRSDDGHVVPSGLYVVSIHAAGKAETVVVMVMNR